MKLGSTAPAVFMTAIFVFGANAAASEEVRLNCSSEQMRDGPWPLIIDEDAGKLTWPERDGPSVEMVFEIVSVTEGSIVAFGNQETNPDEVVILNRRGGNSYWTAIPSESPSTVWEMECIRGF